MLLKVIKSEIMRWVGHVAGMGENRNALNSERRKPLGSPESR